MAKKKNQQTVTLGEVAEGVIMSTRNNVDTLFRRHYREIEKILNTSDPRTVSVNFAVLVDNTDSTPKVRTRIRYCETVTDEMIDSLEDPKQPTLFKREEEAKDGDGESEGSE